MYGRNFHWSSRVESFWKMIRKPIVRPLRDYAYKRSLCSQTGDVDRAEQQWCLSLLALNRHCVGGGANAFWVGDQKQQPCNSRRRKLHTLLSTNQTWRQFFFSCWPSDLKVGCFISTEQLIQEHLAFFRLPAATFSQWSHHRSAEHQHQSSRLLRTDAGICRWRHGDQFLPQHWPVLLT